MGAYPEFWNLALIQADLALGEPVLNRVRLEALMEKAVAAAVKPDLIMLPEMWNTAYALERIQELADPEAQISRGWLSAFATKHGVHVVGGSVAERGKDGLIRNTLLIYDRQGREAGRYSKIHLFRLMQEEKHLTEGVETVTFDLEGLLCGASICYDIRFPELSRTLALAGAKLLFVPAEWPHPRLHHWRTLLQARAIENQMYVVACNRVGADNDNCFFGHSLIVDPWGEVVSEGGKEEEIVTGRIRLPLVDEVRKRIPVFEDRRPDLYRI
ncbi:carbon-nitrogen family hydrolase [Paenibacillus physcomitrellae]|uniref:Hydrolase n=1 Tax=Paenibacillus physcomitrellae TaxID=1619311 RepID=A0ABQ1FNZ2_9BACL|nr:carbon-nitrogen family hydrolase [Paenibacillus physcomitrellae]GGA23605.1 hydrolase [Paenibacillus physcomitrellae]